jgi:hypothetical protein
MDVRDAEKRHDRVSDELLHGPPWRSIAARISSK